MKDSRKTKAQLIAELSDLRSQLEVIQRERQQLNGNHSINHTNNLNGVHLNGSQASKTTYSNQLSPEFLTKINRLQQTNILLTNTDSFQSLCKKAVKLGRKILGFDRIALWLLGDDARFMNGTFGIDEQGNLRDERSIHRMIDGQLAELFSSQVPANICQDVPLYDDQLNIVGEGWCAMAVLRDGESIIGCLVTDNLISRKPISNEQLELLAMYGQAVGHLCVSKRIEEALHHSEERFSKTFRASPSAVSISELETGYFLDVNDGFLTMFDYCYDEIIGRTAIELDLWSSLGDYTRLMRALKNTGHISLQEVELTTQAGKIRQALCSMEMIELSGKPHVLTMFLDLTERKMLENQLRQVQKMEAVGQLAGGIAHDFNNILTAVNGHASLALRRLDEDNPLHRSIKAISDAGGRAAALTQQLLAFSRKQMLQPKVLNLNNATLNMVDMLRPLISEDIQLETRPAEKKLYVKVDPSQLEQVILNLAVNARDAMSEGGKLTIEVSHHYHVADPNHVDLAKLTPGPYATLRIKDTGIGIDKALQQRIFEPFFTTKLKGRGTGLGLATVYGIVEQSGGHITVDSILGKGTTFTIYLPLVETPQSTTDETSYVTPPSFEGAETILLVEDDEMVRSLTRQVLSQHGYHVLEAENGDIAKKIAQRYQDKIDLLLTDVVMPGSLSGPQLAQQQLILRKDLKVLFISGYANDVIVQRGSLATKLNFLKKPFTADVLIQKVREVLDIPVTAKTEKQVKVQEPA